MRPEPDDVDLPPIPADGLGPVAAPGATRHHGRMSSRSNASPVLFAALAEPPSDRCWVGLSGGLDSSVLLHALAILVRPSRPELDLRAVHVHHGLMPEADAWVTHCAQLCEDLAVPLKVLRVDVARNAPEGLEAAARAARRAAFASMLAHGDTLALAHHLGDQAETFLMRLARRSGVDGLGAMRALANLEGSPARIWRPLLSLTRVELERYARDAGLGWIVDPSNAHPRHPRNRLRSEVLPALRQVFPDFEQAIGASAALLAEESSLLFDVTRRALASVQGVDPTTLLLDRLARLHRSLQQRVLRLWMDDLGLPRPGLDAVNRCLEWATAPGEPGIQTWPGVRLYRYRQLLHAEPDDPLELPEHPLDWDGRSPLAWVGGRLELAGPATSARRWRVGPRRGGERIRLCRRDQATPLKNVLQDLGIPPWERARLPLLFDASGTLLAAGDLVLSAELEDALGPTAQHLVWCPPDRRQRQREPLPQSR